ncbi:thiamine pyrophosphate-binding protein [Bradyrhizobium diazoefficiens]|nr:thiamine pyrophosphate-binding protein [Bradyrhizobium diazoefficiens]
MSGAEAAVRMLQIYGVKHIFGLCGDTSLPFYDALFRLDHGMEHILTRDERSAAYMADAYARVTGRVGVCEGPSGGGATYLLPGVIEANESSIPVLGITSDVPVTSRGKFPLTELNQEALYRPLTKWNTVVDRPDQVPAAFRSAFRAMTTGKPGAAHIGLPYDIQKEPLSEELIWAQSEHGRFPAWRSAPDPTDVRRAAEAILAARAPVFIVGGGVVIAGAMEELSRLALLLNIPVCTTVSGQGCLSAEHPLCVGVVGTNGGVLATREVVEMADLVVFIGARAGSTTTEHWKYPSRAAKVIHIDADPMVISANYKTDVALVGDAKLALLALVDAIESSGPISRAGKIDGRSVAAFAKAKRREAFELLAFSDDTPIRPERVLRELHALLPRDAVVVADPGTPCPYFSGYYDFLEPGRHFITNRAQGALGYAMAGAMGAWYGRPGTKCVSVMGDGSFGFTVGELETIVRKRIPLLMIVFSNAVFGWIKASQKFGYNERYFSVDFDRTDHARVAEAFGVKSSKVVDPNDLGSTLAAAIEHDGPTLVDIISQPLEETAVPVSAWMG